MSQINVRRKHGTTLKRARTGASRVAEQLAEEFYLESRWHGDTLIFERSGVNGELTVDKKEISIEVRLGFMTALLKPVIESEIHKFLDEKFGPSDPA